MGKQTVFFATPADLTQMFEKVLKKEVIILDEYGSKLNVKEIYDRCKSCFDGELYGCNFFITLDSLRIVFMENQGRQWIDPMKSEVIVFHPCTQQAKIMLDTSSVDIHFKKGDFIVIDDTDKYEQMMTEYMKHPVYLKNPNYIDGGYQHSRFWLAPTYLNSSGETAKKNKAICDLYLSLQKYVKSNYRLATDGFGYIGNDAYEQYCLGNFVPCSGKERIKF